METITFKNVDLDVNCFSQAFHGKLDFKTHTLKKTLVVAQNHKTMESV